MRFNTQFLNDKDFLKELSAMPIQTQYIKITSLDYQENPLESLEGIVSSGSITVDGDSAVRRTANLTFIVLENDKPYTDLDSHLSLNKKVGVEIGIDNLTKYTEYGDIIYFPMGVFGICGASINNTVNGITASVTLKDKMCFLNGECGGTFPAAVTLNLRDEMDDSGAIVTTKTPVYQIIQELVSEFGQEDLSKIYINDVDAKIKEVVKWIGENSLYLYELDNTAFFSLNPNDGTAPTEYKTGQDIGYFYTDFVYPEAELTADAGSSVVEALDKIKNMLGNYEYYYDIEGNFIFQEKRNYFNTSKATTDIREFEQYIKEIGYLMELSGGKSAYQFNDASLFTNITNNPQYNMIKNDFIVWGKRDDVNGQKWPIRYHLAIDKKPPLGGPYENIIIYRDDQGNLCASAPQDYTDQRANKLLETANNPANFYYLVKRDDSEKNEIYFKDELGKYSLFLKEYDTESQWPKLPLEADGILEKLSINGDDFNNVLKKGVRDNFITGADKEKPYQNYLGKKGELTEAATGINGAYDKNKIIECLNSDFYDYVYSNPDDGNSYSYSRLWDKYFTDIFKNIFNVNNNVEGGELYNFLTGKTDSILNSFVHLVSNAIVNLKDSNDESLIDELTKQFALMDDCIRPICDLKLSQAWSNSFYRIGQIYENPVKKENDDGTITLTGEESTKIIFINGWHNGQLQIVTLERHLDEKGELQSRTSQLYPVYKIVPANYGYTLFSSKSQETTITDNVQFYMSNSVLPEDLSQNFVIQLIAILADYFLELRRIYSTTNFQKRYEDLEKDLLHIVKIVDGSDRSGLLYWIAHNSKVLAEYRNVKEIIKDTNEASRLLESSRNRFKDNIIPIIRDTRVIESTSANAGSDGKTKSKHSKKYYQNYYWRYKALTTEFEDFRTVNSYKLSVDSKLKLKGEKMKFTYNQRKKYNSKGQLITNSVEDKAEDEICFWPWRQNEGDGEGQNIDDDLYRQLGSVSISDINIGKYRIDKTDYDIKVASLLYRTLDTLIRKIYNDDTGRKLVLSQKVVDGTAPEAGEDYNTYLSKLKNLTHYTNSIKTIFDEANKKSPEQGLLYIEEHLLEPLYNNVLVMNKYGKLMDKMSVDSNMTMKDFYDTHMKSCLYAIRSLRLMNNTTSTVGNKQKDIHCVSVKDDKTTRYIKNGSHYHSYRTLTLMEKDFWKKEYVLSAKSLGDDPLIFKGKDTRDWDCKTSRPYLYQCNFGPYAKFVEKHGDSGNTSTYCAIPDKHIPIRSTEMYSKAMQEKQKIEEAFKKLNAREEKYSSTIVDNLQKCDNNLNEILFILQNIKKRCHDEMPDLNFSFLRYEKDNKSIDITDDIKDLIKELQSFKELSQKIYAGIIEKSEIDARYVDNIIKHHDENGEALDDTGKKLATAYFTDKKKTVPYNKIEHIRYICDINIRIGREKKTIKSWVDYLLKRAKKINTQYKDVISHYKSTIKAIKKALGRDIRQKINSYVVCNIVSVDDFEENGYNDNTGLFDLREDNAMYKLIYNQIKSSWISWNTKHEDLSNSLNSLRARVALEIYQLEQNHTPKYYLKADDTIENPKKPYVYDMDSNAYVIENECGPQTIEVKDFRTQLYMDGIVAEVNGTHRNYYYAELKNEWPKIYNIVEGKFKDNVTKDATNIEYFLDFIDSNAEIAELMIDNIGRRTKVLVDDSVNCIFEPYIPDLVIVKIDDEHYNELTDEYKSKGIKYVQVDSSIYNSLATGGHFNSAYFNIQDLLRQSTDYNSTVSISGIPLYYLEPNTRIELDNEESGVNGDYFIKSISYSLGNNSTMTLNCVQSIDRM